MAGQTTALFNFAALCSSAIALILTSPQSAHAQVAGGKTSTSTDNVCNQDVTSSSLACGERAVAGSASASFATALGGNSKASGQDSTAVGQGSIASGTGGTVLGQSSIAAGTGDIAAGITAFAGTKDGNSASNGTNGNIAIGSNSGLVDANAFVPTGGTRFTSYSTTANGGNSIAIGTAARATGGSTTASGAYSTANGNFGTATGFFSTAGNVGTTATGYNALASGLNATAIGIAGAATGNASIALGANTLAEQDNTVSVGNDGSAYLHRDGQSSSDPAFTRRIVNVSQGVLSATSNDAVTGQQLYATNLAVAALQAATGAIEVDPNGAIGIGLGQRAQGNGAVAIGDPNSATGTGAVAIGANNTATGDGAVAIGNGTTANGAGNVALGNGASATGANSVALGGNSVASVANTVSVGAAGAERTITNLAAGVNPTDAVNLGQLNATAAATLASARTYTDTQISGINTNLTALRRESRQGIAQAMAMAQAPMPSAPGRTAWAFNLATYRNQVGQSLALAHRFNTSTPLYLSASVSYSSGDNVSGRVGIGGEF